VPKNNTVLPKTKENFQVFKHESGIGGTAGSGKPAANKIDMSLTALLLACQRPSKVAVDEDRNGRIHQNPIETIR
jgi:hypothetical protein